MRVQEQPRNILSGLPPIQGQEPARTFIPRMRPIVFSKPVERPYIEGYQAVPQPAYIPPEQPRQETEPLIIVQQPIIMQPPAQAERIIIHEPSGVSSRPEKERTPNRETPVSSIDDNRTHTGDAARSQDRMEPPDRKTVVPPQQKELTPDNKINYPPSTKTIVPEPENNCGSIDGGNCLSIDPQLFEPPKEPDKPSPSAVTRDFKKVGLVRGRQRRYDELGENDIEPVREVFLMIHLTGQDWPDMSAPMKRYYRKMYFTKPKRGSKDYATHKGCYERREQWIREHTHNA